MRRRHRCKDGRGCRDEREGDERTGEDDASLPQQTEQRLQRRQRRHRRRRLRLALRPRSASLSAAARQDWEPPVTTHRTHPFAASLRRAAPEPPRLPTAKQLCAQRCMGQARAPPPAVVARFAASHGPPAATFPPPPFPSTIPGPRARLQPGCVLRLGALLGVLLHTAAAASAAD